ncbi:hypothetical protein [Desulfobulbus oralis]|uniref:hypothetical protein n=1 Tax=Desulfobulbus oralis TaxID=1986146 RepID=UPI0011B08CF9|nr:hypothetical protein [Desulfobulbus oralis]
MNKKDAVFYEMYPYGYCFKGNLTILIWITNDNERDSFLLDKDKQLVTSSNIEGFSKILGTDFNKVHWNEGSYIDFDKFLISLKTLKVDKSSSKSTCIRLLNGWNFIEDILHTFNMVDEIKKLKTPTLNKVYEKIFHGNNLQSITPEGKSYNPLWTRSEIKEVRGTFLEIWNLLLQKGIIKLYELL